MLLSGSLFIHKKYEMILLIRPPMTFQLGKNNVSNKNTAAMIIPHWYKTPAANDYLFGTWSSKAVKDLSIWLQKSKQDT